MKLSIGRIRMFNKPEPKGEKLPIPDISDYTRYVHVVIITTNLSASTVPEKA